MFEHWSTNNPDNRNNDEDCTHLISPLISTLPVTLEFGQWNDAPCTSTEVDDDVGPNPLRPICKQEQTV